MNRTPWLAATALILVLGATSGRSRSATAGDTGPDGGPRAGGFRAVGAFGGDDQFETVRSVRLEMEGGQKLEGTIRFRPVIVDGDLGRYTIWPDKIKTIQFLKRANVDDAGLPDGQRDAQQNANLPRGMGGMGMRPQRMETLVRGKVVTTSDKVIIGDIHIPYDFALQLDFGTLAVAPEKLRTLTMIGGDVGEQPEASMRGGARPGGSAPPGQPAAPDRPPARTRVVPKPEGP